MAACACISAPSIAWAQDLPQPVFGPSEQMREEDDRFALPNEREDVYAAQGIRVGSFTFKPSLEVSSLVDTNVLARASGDRDAAVVAKGRFNLDWSRGDTKVSTYAYGSVVRFADLKTENSEEMAVGGEVEHRFAPTVVLRARGETGNFVEDRNAIFSSSQSLTPVEYDRNFANATLAISPGRLAIVPGFEIDRLNYKDNRLASNPATVLVQRDRSFRRLEPSLSLGYSFSRDTTVFVGGSYNDRTYDYSIPFDRDSTGYAVFGGVRFQPSALTRLNLAAGYVRQNYRGALHDPHGLYLRGSLDWTPTRTTLVTATVERDIAETGNLLAGGSVRTRASARITQQVLRTLTFTGRVEWRRFSLPQLNAKEERTRLYAGIQSQVTRHIEIFADGRLTIGRGDPVATPFRYEGFRAVIGMRIRP